MEDELIQEFITESREHLATIEGDILAIEKAGDNADHELLNKVFRAAHSIKGAAGFFELNKVKELAHKAETVLDMLRSRKMHSNAEITNVLLRAFDKLRELIDYPASSNEAEIVAEVESLESLAHGYMPGNQKSILTEEARVADKAHREPVSVTRFELEPMKQNCEVLFLIQLDLLHDVDRKGRQILEVFEKLQEFGEIVDCKLNLDKVGTLDSPFVAEVPIELVFATAHEAVEICSVLAVPEDRIQRVEAAILPGEAQHSHEDPPAANPGQSSGRRRSATDPQPSSQPVPSRSVRDAEPAPLAANSSGDETLRVNVGLLDTLMNLAGELVLSRNQFQAAIDQHNPRMLTSAGQRLSQVTSEIQDAIMRTRLQPIENVFSRFPRVIRDLAKSLGKEVDLEIAGKEVALDRSLVEGLSDPLTHMVRNAIDHGIELPEVRVQSGKPRAGTLRVEARYEAGQVIIEIADDGKGIDRDRVAAAAIAKGLVTIEQVKAMSPDDKAALILLPGLSTAERVTQISGRGVGMDVVKANLDRLGGQIEIASRQGQGTSFRIKLPLTLTIIPALIVSIGQERFAIPQTNVEELLRIRSDDPKRRIEVVGGTTVLVLRDRIVPLLHLDEFLNGTGAANEDDSVRPARPCHSTVVPTEIAIINSGTLRYGLVVGSFHYTEEIVVKPLGRDLKESREYAGATILGDGTVALILDAAGLAARAELCSASPGARAINNAHQCQEPQEREESSHALLSFRNGAAEYCAVPLEIVRRIERVKGSQLEMVGGRRTMQYRNHSLPVVALSDVASVEQIDQDADLAVIVTTLYDREIGILVRMPVDVIETDSAIDSTTHRQPGISGSTIVGRKTTLLVDLVEIVDSAYPEWRNRTNASSSTAPCGSLILLAEDSDFFRAQVKRFLEADGHRVIDAVDGEDAWDLLLRNLGGVSVLVTDIEMPRLSGLELTARIRSDQRTRNLPVIAVSSLAADEDLAAAKAAGVNEYEIKLDRDNLLSRVRSVLAQQNFYQAACSAD